MSTQEVSIGAADPTTVLSQHTRDEIDHWLTKYPPEQKRSAVAAALRAATSAGRGIDSCASAPMRRHLPGGSAK